MNLLWKQLLYLHGHARPASLPWREQAPRVPTGTPAQPLRPMLRWRAVLRTALIGA